MKKKIGLIDLFIDEWHANNYPAWFRSAPRADEFELSMAWEEAAKDGMRPLKKWCADFGMTPAKSIEEVVEKSDCVCVLAPSNPEVHYRLAEVALKSGKPLYIDKPFAPDKAAAEKIFALAEASGTPLMSSSALRFGDGILAARKNVFAGKHALFVHTTGGGSSFDEYGIHQLEMIVSLLGPGAVSVLQRRNSVPGELLIEYPDGRFASASYHPYFAFTAAASGAVSEQGTVITDTGHMFENLIAEILDFFATGIPSINPRETIEIASLLGASLKARSTPGVQVRL